MKQIATFWTIAKKEFYGYLNSATAYVVLVPFLVLSIFLFFRSALVLNDANLRPFVEMLPWFLMVIGPALAMRAFADEKRRDTTELLFAHPLSEWTLVAGKYAGLLMFYGLMLIATLPVPVTLFFFSRPDLGEIIGQYLGMMSVGGVFLAIGLAASALIGSAVGSFLAAAAINFVLVLLGMSFVVLMLPGFLGRIINEVAILPHVASVARGVIDFRDLLYFATIILTALVLAVIKLSERKVVELPTERKKLWVIMSLVVAVGLAGNVLMYEFPLRLDLTASQRYSLSRGTQQLLNQLPDRLTISLYTSQNLPGPLQVTLRETSDWLKDYKRIGKKISLRSVITDASAGNRQEALERGVKEVQFNQIGSNSFQVQTGFLGLELRYGDQREVIDFIEDSSNLEYQLSRAILKLIQEDERQIGLLASMSTQLAQLEAGLNQQYDLKYITEDTKTEDLTSLSGVIVVDDGTTETATTAGLLTEYIKNGGNVAAFVDGVNVSRQALTVQKSRSQVIQALKDIGISFLPGLVYDTQLNESVTMGQGSVRYIIPYPFWIRALNQQGALPANNAVSNTLLGWASEVSAEMSNEWSVRPLLLTSKAGGVDVTGTMINPQITQALPPANGEKTVGLVAERKQQRLVVVGDADVVADEFLANSAENQIFTANVVDWVAADPILNQIPRRSVSRNVFTFTSATEAATAQYANIGGPAAVTAAFGGWWLWRRRKLTNRTRLTEETNENK